MPMMEQNPLSLKGQNENTMPPTVLIRTGNSTLFSESSGVENYKEVYNIHRENHSKHNILFLQLHF